MGFNKKLLSYKDHPVFVAISLLIAGFLAGLAAGEYFDRKAEKAATDLVAAKDETISNLERSINQLSQTGPVPQAVVALQERVEALENSMRPYTRFGADADPLFGDIVRNGRVEQQSPLAAMQGEAIKLQRQGRRDVAFEIAENLIRKHPDLAAGDYIFYHLYMSDNDTTLAERYAVKVAQKAAESSRLNPTVFLHAISRYRKEGKLKEADELATSATLALRTRDAKFVKTWLTSATLLFGHTPKINASVADVINDRLKTTAP